MTIRFVIFGLSVSSSWGNGHATLWRGIVRALDALGHEVVFYEKDVPYYAQHRDLTELPGRSRLRLYGALAEIEHEIADALRDADVAIVTSYCPDGRRACDLVLGSRARCRVFYDLDTPVTLQRLERGEDVEYLPLGRHGAPSLGGFDLVLSYTGGAALAALRSRLGARHVAPLYGGVDPTVHRPEPPCEDWLADVSYLGTYAADRQDMLDRLFLAPARARPARKLILGGSMYPEDFPWAPNVWYVAHVAPPDHPAFYASSSITVSTTRRPFAALGYCPSGRLFEAAACRTPVLSDVWEGLDTFYTPGSEILVARTTEEALAAIDLEHGALMRIGRRARERTLDEHTGAHRARELVARCDEAIRPRAAAARTLETGEIA